MNVCAPVLENSGKLEFGIFHLNDIIGLGLVDMENLMDVLLGLLGEEDFCIGINFVKDSIDQLIDELEPVDV